MAPTTKGKTKMAKTQRQSNHLVGDEVREIGALYRVKRDFLVSKETYLPCQKRLTSVKRDLLPCQKRPTTVSKETYYRVKRDFLVSKKTYYRVKRDLIQCQKRPNTVSKETF